MSVLDFFPVHEKQNLGKIPKDEFVKTRGLTLYTIPTTLLDNCQQIMWIINR